MGTERIFVGITSYRRPGRLNSLLNDISAVQGTFDLDVRVYDDGSTFEPAKFWWHGVDWVTFYRHEHRGKEGFWRTMNQIVQDAQTVSYDYLFTLQDDLRLVDRFFDKAILTWEAIDDPKKLALSTILTPDREGRQLWTGCQPEVREFAAPVDPRGVSPRIAQSLDEIGWSGTDGWEIPVWRTDWVDCIWMSDGRLAHRIGGIAEVDSRRWDQSPQMSSGVGAQITWWGNKLGWNFYQVAQTLVRHGDHPSLMNPTNDGEKRLVTHG